MTIISEVSPNEIPKPIPAPPSNMAKSSSKNAASSSKPGRAHRSRKMSRAPQPPNSETPAMNQKSVTSPTSAGMVNQNFSVKYDFSHEFCHFKLKTNYDDSKCCIF